MGKWGGEGVFRTHKATPTPTGITAKAVCCVDSCRVAAGGSGSGVEWGVSRVGGCAPSPPQHVLSRRRPDAPLEERGTQHSTHHERCHVCDPN
eukprot:TRINITY_DN50568_c0_g1_i1.p3 TRINITY_DN50568_c0_g1~~TRINITY_DN50568_c0_g1_i1.p3  ORF type:complete len:104 (-),score=0.90 TRINITY_DN50568_c0_g1_i1:870-1148(-)